MVVAGELAEQPMTAAPRQRCRAPAIPRELRKEIREHCRDIRKNYAQLFKGDPKLKERIARFTRALLPPRPRRPGRPRNPETTRMVALYRKLRREFPEMAPREILHQVALAVVPGYGSLPSLDQGDIREDLKARMKSRQRKRRPRRKTVH